MKRILLSLFCLSISLSLFAQKTLPEIKAGTNMVANAYLQGVAYPLIFSVKSIKAPITLAWSVEGYGDGEFVISEKALESGKSLFLTQPELGTTKLSDSETYSLISKAAYKLLIDTKAFTYSGIKFKAKTTGLVPFKIGDKEIDATQIASEDGKIELWILNNPNFPFILQTVGLPIDIIISEIK